MAESPRRKKGRSRRPPIVPDVLNPVHQLRVMGRLVRRQTKKPGSAPGTVVHTGPKKIERTRVTLLDYDGGESREREVEDVREVWDFRDSATVSWINVDGLHDVDLVQRVGEHFGIHPLVQEDIASVGQRPKVEDHDGYLYLVLPMLTWDVAAETVETEQLSIVLGPTWVLTFQERTGDVLDPVRERIRAAGGRIRTRGADYLAYALVDAVVDSYFGVLENVGELAEDLELQVLEDPSATTIERLHRLAREVLVIRRAIWPLREMSSDLIRSESPLVQKATRVFLRDVQDHAAQISDTVESLRDVLAGTMDLYLSHIGHRQNEIMKVLTIMASIFIPLTFIAGVYGMNFEHMPELAVPWAYPALLVLMALVAGGMLLYFRRKGWL